jgi:esterase/lipase superfamily enzyme
MGNGSYAAGAANPAGLECGIATVQIPPSHVEGELECPSIWRFEFVEDKERHFVITNRGPITSVTQFYQRLAAGLTASDSEAFVFIHGYNVGFDDGVLRTAQLFTDLHFSGVPILFSWPAQDAWWRYLSAEDQATAAVPYLQEVLRGIATVGKPMAINVIAHSLGNRVVVNALSGLMQDPEMRKTALFRNLVLAAPDVSLDNFNAVATAVKQAAARVTIYSSSADIPLQLSQQLHRFERLGEAPPVHVPPGIDAVDASAVTRDLLGHSYFSRAGSMLDDLRQLLKDGLPPPRRLQPVTQRGEVRYWRVPR